MTSKEMCACPATENIFTAKIQLSRPSTQAFSIGDKIFSLAILVITTGGLALFQKLSIHVECFSAVF